MALMNITSKSKSTLLLEQIHAIENSLKNIHYCEVIVNKYKSINFSFMNVVDKVNKYDSDVHINPMMVYKIINNDELLVNNDFFKYHIHDIYCDMVNKYILNPLHLLYLDSKCIIHNFCFIHRSM